ncbi:hypothetical protein CLF_110306 [Clonorchis sinensis]|uniref:Uncharacterized protein n=1 Tax=Clonorchis sinensis TaxID=79923 RepID=G7YTE1_CLOSI|nr:hypothetical protein CLF_110306 [Clonorchis sinensis]
MPRRWACVSGSADANKWILDVLNGVRNQWIRPRWCWHSRYLLKDNLTEIPLASAERRLNHAGKTEELDCTTAQGNSAIDSSDPSPPLNADSIMLVKLRNWIARRLKGTVQLTPPVSTRFDHLKPEAYRSVQHAQSPVSLLDSDQNEREIFGPNDECDSIASNEIVRIGKSGQPIIAQHSFARLADGCRIRTR